jgi:hypothetical protein
MSKLESLPQSPNRQSKIDTFIEVSQGFPRNKAGTRRILQWEHGNRAKNSREHISWENKETWLNLCGKKETKGQFPRG